MRALQSDSNDLSFLKLFFFTPFMVQGNFDATLEFLKKAEILS